jgi:hypothetical protein
MTAALRANLQNLTHTTNPGGYCNLRGTGVSCLMPQPAAA